MTRTSTTLKIENWDEQTIEELPGGGSVKRADVTLGAGPDGIGPGSLHTLLHYAADGTSRYVSLLQVEGALAGKSGRLVLLGEGSYNGTTASGQSTIVAATGELTGLTGSATSESTASDYPDMPLVLDYDEG